MVSLLPIFTITTVGQEDNLPHRRDIITGFQAPKVDGMLNDINSDKMLNEWQDAKQLEVGMQGNFNTEFSLNLYQKIISENLYIGGSSSSSILSRHNMDLMALQFDSDANGKLSDGDLRLQLDLFPTKLQTGNPLLDIIEEPKIQIYENGMWRNLLGQKRDTFEEIKVTYISLGSIKTSFNPMIKEYQFEIRFSMKIAEQILNDAGYELSKRSKFAGLNTANYALYFEDNEGEIYAFPNDIERNDDTGVISASSYHLSYYDFDLTHIPIQFVDLGIDNIELTQTSQNATETISLAQDRDTLARVYVDNPTGSAQSVKVTLKGIKFTRGSTVLLSPISTTFDAPTNAQRDRDDLDDTANFELPSHWLNYHFLLVGAEITVLGGLDGRLANNNKWETFTLTDTRDLTIYRMAVNRGTATSPDLPTAARMTSINDWFEMAYPTTPTYHTLGWETLGEFSGSSDDLKREMNTILVYAVLAILLGGSIPFPDQFHATTPLSFGGGSSDPFWGSGAGLAYSSWGSWDSTSRELVMAHEINHNILPTPSAYHIGGCTADNSDSDWNSFYGNSYFKIHDLGWNTANGLEDVNEFDLMSYCTDSDAPVKWLSGYRYQRLIDRLASWTSGPSPSLALTQSETGVDQEKDTPTTSARILSGFINNQNVIVTKQEAHLLHSYEISSDKEIDIKLLTNRFGLPEYNPEFPYRLEVNYTDGRVVFASLNPTFRSVEGETLPTESFTFIIPDGDKVESISLVGEGDNIDKASPLLASGISYSEPQFDTKAFPFDGTVKRGAIYNLTWSQKISSGTQYRAQYSPDNGTTWYSFGLPTSQQRIPVYFDQLPGSEGKLQSKFRLLASTGLSTVKFETPNFHLTPLSPEVRLYQNKNYTGFNEDQNGNLLPIKESKTIDFTVGDVLSLKAIGSTNMGLDRLNYNWSFISKGGEENMFSSSGQSIKYQTKMPGVGKIVVTGTDPSTGLTSSASINIRVHQEKFKAKDLYNEFMEKLVELRKGYHTHYTAYITDTKTRSQAVPFSMIAVLILIPIGILRLHSTRKGRKIIE